MSIKNVLMKRDKISEEIADELIDDATGALMDCLDEGDMERAENICGEYFGLEPDYLLELMDFI